MSSEPNTQRSSSRRRRRGKRPGDREPKDGKANPNRAPQAAVARPALPPKSVFDDRKPADAELSAEEKVELKQHFAFLARSRKVLRLSFNAAEDLLINGAREPEDRGVCQHLLNKIDRASVNAALARIPEPEQRTRFLGGVVRFSRDAAMVILYLESLSATAPKAEAAATLVAALKQLNFAEVSAAQLRRLLELMVALLAATDRPHLVISLLRSPSFRAAFDQAADVLPAELASLFVPMRAVVGALFAPEPEAPDPELLHQGLQHVLAAPTHHLTGFPERARARLLEAALSLPHASESHDGALNALLNTFPKESRLYSQMATKRAMQLLQQGREALAQPLLLTLREHHPDYRLPGRWLDALAAPRLGEVTLPEAKAVAVGLNRGFWVPHQRPVWTFVGPTTEVGAFAAAAARHMELALPGLVPLFSHGVGAQATPYLVFPQLGQPVRRALKELRREPQSATECARSGVEVLIALALAGVALPDAGSERFLLDAAGHLVLFNLVGSRTEAPEQAMAVHLELGRSLVAGVLAAILGPKASAELCGRLPQVESLPAMARLLALWA